MRLLFILLIIAYTVACRASDQAQVIDSIVKAADQAEVPRELLLSICWVESSYRSGLKPKLDGLTPSYGICQVKLKTAQHMDKLFGHRIKATSKRLMIPYINAFYAAKYLKYQLVRYNQNWKKAVTAYNKGHATTGNSIYMQKVFVVLYNQVEEEN